MEKKELFDIKTKCFLIKEYGSDYYNTCVQNKDQMIVELCKHPIKKSCKADWQCITNQFLREYDERIMIGCNDKRNISVLFLGYYIDKRKLKNEHNNFK